MKFRYLGNKEDMQVYGYDFSNGATPDVSEEFVIAKLAGNNHFEALAEDKPVRAKKVKPEEPEVLIAADVPEQTALEIEP